eukprot:10043021-Ditylum_brightwellii.AAC.1
MWQTCCALHNMLLKSDDLDKNWIGVNQNAEDEEEASYEVPFAVSRLNRDMNDSIEGIASLPTGDYEWKNELDRHAHNFMDEN